MGEREIMVKEDLYYNEFHQWIKIESDNTAYVGFTEYAQGEFGSIEFIELPGRDYNIIFGEVCGSIEAENSVIDMIAPLSGEVLRINEDLEANPKLINSSPYEEGWIMKINLTEPDEISRLLDSEDYIDLIKR